MLWPPAWYRAAPVFSAKSWDPSRCGLFEGFLWYRDVSGRFSEWRGVSVPADVPLDGDLKNLEASKWLLWPSNHFCFVRAFCGGTWVSTGVTQTGLRHCSQQNKSVLWHFPMGTRINILAVWAALAQISDHPSQSIIWAMCKLVNSSMEGSCSILHILFLCQNGREGRALIPSEFLRALSASLLCPERPRTPTIGPWRMVHSLMLRSIRQDNYLRTASVPHTPMTDGSTCTWTKSCGTGTHTWKNSPAWAFLWNKPCAICTFGSSNLD